MLRCICEWALFERRDDQSRYRRLVAWRRTSIYSLATVSLASETGSGQLFLVVHYAVHLRSKLIETPNVGQARMHLILSHPSYLCMPNAMFFRRCYIIAYAVYIFRDVCESYIYHTYLLCYVTMPSCCQQNAKNSAQDCNSLAPDVSPTLAWRFVVPSAPLKKC